ncbi:MAG: cobalamin biosynthesis protein [Methanosphaera sp.]|uniref:cobalamin biosynthesis protein n=1 Tax=Methanosphaera sp. TaxID=2666342 RepID=UPI0025F2B186|nr:cobalamin biosynthesis protein [Methanosphaera sp.]MCI5866705.1 cobalamin biosynthesis protein [Methanosphaera sp.]MDD6534220.1 cobalamin biosynthesis protein [Methanosphaera sp.]MDY3956396.1 cobalamin biosynthesis protein [Methanosphaera sp.]
MIYESLIYSVIIIVLAVVIDTIFGEVPDKIHPVIYMGNVIEKLKNYLPKTRFSGLLTIITTNFIFVTLTLLLLIISLFINKYLYIIIAAIILSTTFSIKFLIQSVKDIQIQLKKDINIARKSMSYLVSRDTEQLTEARIASAAIETLTENITDSIISPLFYVLVFSIPFGMIPAILIGVIYRVSNTMDAMLGYQTEELIDIGRYPALLDDVLNYIPARITGIYVIIASALLRYDYKSSYTMMRKYATKTPSPNSGYSMAATAGALNITLVKEGVYTLGEGTEELTGDKIQQAIEITKLTSVLFILTMLVIYFIAAMLII